VLHLPQVLSPQEVAPRIDAAEMPFHRILLMTMYATGARRAEVARLKISAIDSQRMVIHIQGGKGRKDRDVMGWSDILGISKRTDWSLLYTQFLSLRFARYRTTAAGDRSRSRAHMTTWRTQQAISRG
jgi:integrase